MRGDMGKYDGEPLVTIEQKTLDEVLLNISILIADKRREVQRLELIERKLREAEE